MDRHEDEEAFRREIANRVEAFIVDFKPLIQHYIYKYTNYPKSDFDDIYQDVSIYLYRRIPVKYHFDNLDGLFTYCKKMTYWYLKSRMGFEARTKRRQEKVIAKRGIYEPRQIFVEKHSMLDFNETIDYLGKYAYTPRDQEVLALLAQHYERPDIEKELGISHQRVAQYCLKFKKYLLMREKSENV